jgi:hypothetical protein
LLKHLDPVQKAEKEIEAGLHRLLTVRGRPARARTGRRPELQLCVDADAQGDGDLNMPDQEEQAQQWQGRVFPPVLPCAIFYLRLLS